MQHVIAHIRAEKSAEKSEPKHTCLADTQELLELLGAPETDKELRESEACIQSRFDDAQRAMLAARIR